MRLFFYRLSSSPLGKSILKTLSFAVSVPYRTKPTSEKRQKLQIAITIDTEGGYVAPNERRVWQKEAQNAYQGYYSGIRNIRIVLRKHNVKATFFLNTHCFSATGKNYAKIISELKSLLKEGHEIGLHPHPDSDKALQQKLGRSFPATSCFFYTQKELARIIIASKQLINEHLGQGIGDAISSIRWGNWALNTEGARAIAKCGLKKDSSATPGIRGHLRDTRKYDWSRSHATHHWPLSTTDYQSTTTNQSPITEIPISTFSFFGIKLRADPLYSELLKQALLSFHGSSRSARPSTFVVMTHSSEAVMKDGTATQALRDLDEFIGFAKSLPSAAFCTIRDC